jgi:hypothetical protein
MELTITKKSVVFAGVRERSARRGDHAEPGVAAATKPGQRDDIAPSTGEAIDLHRRTGLDYPAGVTCLGSRAGCRLVWPTLARSSSQASAPHPCFKYLQDWGRLRPLGCPAGAVALLDQDAAFGRYGHTSDCGGELGERRTDA